MAEAVYILCALTSCACAALLLRAWWKCSTRLLLWCGLCFLGLGANNILLVIDLMLVPDVNLEFWRNLTALSGLALLVFGLVWDS